MKMKLFLLSQSVNNNYDTYDSCVVCAKNKEEAILITPNGEGFGYKWNGWAHSPGEVDCLEIGNAKSGMEKGVICASYNEG